MNFRHATPADREFIGSLMPDAASWLDEPAVFTTVAEDDGGPAGFVMVALIEERWHPGIMLAAAPKVADVLALAVAPHARRQGAGTRLFDLAVQFAHQYGLRVEADVAEGNTAIQAIVAAAGLRPVAIQPMTYPDGQRAVRVAEEV